MWINEYRYRYAYEYVDVQVCVWGCVCVCEHITMSMCIFIPRYSSEPEHVGDTEQRAENSGNHRHMVQKIIHQAKLCSGN